MFNFGKIFFFWFFCLLELILIKNLNEFFFFSRCFYFVYIYRYNNSQMTLVYNKISCLKRQFLFLGVINIEMFMTMMRTIRRSIY